MSRIPESLIYIPLTILAKALAVSADELMGMGEDTQASQREQSLAQTEAALHQIVVQILRLVPGSEGGSWPIPLKKFGLSEPGSW